MSNINVNHSLSDHFYRHKVPKLIAKVEGNCNNIKTVIVHMFEIAKALNRPPSYPTKYFGIELGVQTQFDHKNKRYIINGSHETSKLQELLEAFIKKFVLCQSCGNPETVLKVEYLKEHLNSVYLKKHKVKTECIACGYSGQLDTTHKLKTFILKNPPEPVLTHCTVKKGKYRSQNERTQKKQINERDNESHNPQNDTNLKNGFPDKDNNNDCCNNTCAETKVISMEKLIFEKKTLMFNENLEISSQDDFVLPELEEQKRLKECNHKKIERCKKRKQKKKDRWEEHSLQKREGYEKRKQERKEKRLVERIRLKEALKRKCKEENKRKHKEALYKLLKMDLTKRLTKTDKCKKENEKTLKKQQNENNGFHSAEQASNLKNGSPYRDNIDDWYDDTGTEAVARHTTSLIFGAKTLMLDDVLEKSTQDNFILSKLYKMKKRLEDYKQKKKTRRKERKQKERAWQEKCIQKIKERSEKRKQKRKEKTIDRIRLKEHVKRERIMVMKRERKESLDKFGEMKCHKVEDLTILKRQQNEDNNSCILQYDSNLKKGLSPKGNDNDWYDNIISEAVARRMDDLLCRTKTIMFNDEVGKSTQDDFIIFTFDNTENDFDPAEFVKWEKRLKEQKKNMKERQKASKKKRKAKRLQEEKKQHMLSEAMKIECNAADALVKENNNVENLFSLEKPVINWCDIEQLKNISLIGEKKEMVAESVKTECKETLSKMKNIETRKQVKKRETRERLEREKQEREEKKREKKERLEREVQERKEKKRIKKSKQKENKKQQMTAEAMQRARKEALPKLGEMIAEAMKAECEETLAKLLVIEAKKEAKEKEIDERLEMEKQELLKEQMEERLSHLKYKERQRPFYRGNSAINWREKERLKESDWTSYDKDNRNNKERPVSQKKPTINWRDREQIKIESSAPCDTNNEKKLLSQEKPAIHWHGREKLKRDNLTSQDKESINNEEKPFSQEKSAINWYDREQLKRNTWAPLDKENKNNAESPFSKKKQTLNWRGREQIKRDNWSPCDKEEMNYEERPFSQEKPTISRYEREQHLKDSSMSLDKENRNIDEVPLSQDKPIINWHDKEQCKRDSQAPLEIENRNNAVNPVPQENNTIHLHNRQIKRDRRSPCDKDNINNDKKSFFQEKPGINWYVDWGQCDKEHRNNQKKVFSRDKPVINWRDREQHKRDSWAPLEKETTEEK